MKELLHQGAESKIYVEEYLGRKMLVKERFQKKYRNSELDEHLTKERIKAECRNIVRCKQAGIKTPAIYLVDFEKRLIYMEHFDTSITIKTYIQKLQNNLKHKDETNKGETPVEGCCKELEEIAKLIGTVLGKMHSSNIVHGDLTTSNMLLLHHDEDRSKELVLIDFGLSHSEASAEDKGVDLYVLERALSSTHANTTELFENIVRSYSQVYGKNCKEVLSKLEDVRARGRKRTMVG